MIPTYVFGFPTGQEQGDYLAVDLGTFCFVPTLLYLTSFGFLRSDLSLYLGML